MRKAYLVVAALALAVSLPVSAKADTVHRRHAQPHTKRVVLPPTPAASAGAVPVTVSNDPLGSAIDQISSGTARSQAASQTVTTNVFGPVLRLFHPPGQSGDL